MKCLIIGATGFAGSAIVQKLRGRGHDVYGLARSPENVSALRMAGVTPLEGNLEDVSKFDQLVQGFEVVVFTPMIAFESEAEVVPKLLDASRRAGARHFLMTSGSLVVGLPAPNGEWNENSFAEDDQFPFAGVYPRPVRLKTEQTVRAAATEGFHTTVVRPGWIWGNGGGIAIKQLIHSVHKTGSVCYLGQGLNLHTHIHVDDLAEVFALAIEKGTPGALYHPVAGEVAFRTVAETVAQLIGRDARSIGYETACEIWGRPYADLSLTVCSRIKATRTRADLGWTPARVELIEDIWTGSYRDYCRQAVTADEQTAWGGPG